MKKFQTVFLLLSFLSISLPGHAAFTIYGTGISDNNGDVISAQADLEFALHDFGFGLGPEDALQITLTNVSSETRVRGNLLTSFFFSLDGVGDLATTSAGFDGLAATVIEKDPDPPSSNVDIAPTAAGDGMYQLVNDSFVINDTGRDFSVYDYGIATVGMGLGFSDAAEGGDNYGIAAAGSDLSSGGLNAAKPLIDTSATFWIVRPESLLSISGQISNWGFGFGSKPDNFVTPEPATMFLFGTGLVGLAGAARRRKKKSFF
jgi:hypothetical protein